MDKKEYIGIKKICEFYQIPESFFVELKEFDLLNPEYYDEDNQSISAQYLSDLEKIMRLRFDLNINMEGIDVIMNLLNKIEKLERELETYKRKLNIWM